MKTQSFRFRGGVVRIAAWHGRPDVASLAVRGRAALAPASIERLLDRVRASGYREVVTNALAPAATLPLVDAGFAVRGRLRILEHDLSSLPPPTRRTRRAVRAERPRLLEIDRAAFDEFWHLDDDALRQASRATPSAHLARHHGRARARIRAVRPGRHRRLRATARSRPRGARARPRWGARRRRPALVARPRRAAGIREHPVRQRPRVRPL